jgi:hypothetical protein
MCDRINEEVYLEARMVYPTGILASQPPRIDGHRCSKGMECNQFNKPACCWAGTHPTYDPFKE